MAGITFSAGQTMVRPGVYNRYVQVMTPLYAGVSDGVVACAMVAQWGPPGEVLELTALKQAKAAFGGECELIRQALTGGANTVYAVRVGTGGSMAACSVADSDGATAVQVKAKYPGARKFVYALTGAEDGMRQFVLSESGVVLERLSFAAGGNEAAELIEAGARSAYMDFAAADGYAGTGLLAETAETAMAAGADMTVDEDDYAVALETLSAYGWNCLCVDSSDVKVHSAVHAYMVNAARDGRMGFAVVGEGVDVALATRMTHSRAFNDYRMVYVGGGWYESDGTLVDGWRAAARMAGMIACVPSSQSVTRRVLSGAVRCAETLTNSQYIACTEAGMLTFSMSPTALVWVENGVTTLNAPMGEDDRGWMKIKRARIRFELMDRLYATVAPMIGNVSNDDDGRASVVQAIQGLLRAMMNEGKLLDGAAVYVDPDNAPQGDSAWFVVEAGDIDALEKVYFTYQFSFAQQ